MAKTTHECAECGNTYTVAAQTEDDVQFCPFCGDPLTPGPFDTDDDEEDFEDEDEFDVDDD